MADVARSAGVSVMTVSYAYSQPERVSDASAAKVREAAAALGYPGPHPGARSLRRGRAGSLGVVLGEPLAYAFEDPQAARFLAGVAEVCAEAATGLTLVPITGVDADVARVADAVVDGFVVWTTADDDPVVDAVAGTSLPAVVHGGPHRDLPVVTIDNRAAAAAVGGLAFAGARRPAVLSFPLDRRRRSAILDDPDPAIATFPITRERLEGYRDAAVRAGREISAARHDAERAALRVAVCPRNSAAEGKALVAQLLAAAEPPDAIAAMSDELALGALEAAAEAGVHLALTGWDDTPAAGPAGLTTVWQSLQEQGAECARIALGRPRAATPPRWRVVQRASTP
jgi:DNA-binding LacI/PurR family transcriptional regulator